jgi:hypothetical protein
VGPTCEDAGSAGPTYLFITRVAFGLRSGGQSAASEWVGPGGVDRLLVQAGTQGDCAARNNYAWWEVYYSGVVPGAAVSVQLPGPDRG